MVLALWERDRDKKKRAIRDAEEAEDQSGDIGAVLGGEPADTDVAQESKDPVETEEDPPKR